MTTRFAKCGWQSGTADESILRGCVLDPEATEPSVRLRSSQKYLAISRNRPAFIGQAVPNTPVYETHSGFKYIGESHDEDKTVPRKQDSSGFSFKSHYSKEDGIVASLLAAEATAARCTPLVSNLPINGLPFTEAISVGGFESLSEVKASQGFGGVL